MMFLDTIKNHQKQVEKLNTLLGIVQDKEVDVLKEQIRLKSMETGLIKQRKDLDERKLELDDREKILNKRHERILEKEQKLELIGG